MPGELRLRGGPGRLAGPGVGQEVTERQPPTRSTERSGDDPDPCPFEQGADRAPCQVDHH